MPSADDRGVRSALAATSDDFRVAIAGRSFDTWEEVTLERAIDAAVGSFAVRVVSPEQLFATGRDGRRSSATRSRVSDSRIGVLYELPFGPQDSVEVVAAGEVLLTGRVDALEAEFDKSGGTQLRIGGRDRAADMVDCSATNKPGEWSNVELRDLARELAAPFGLLVKVAAGDIPRLPMFKLQESETAWSALERACRMRGLLCFSDAFGDLTIEPPAAGGVDGGGRIAQGENLNSAQLAVNDADRFSVYTVRGQQPGTSTAFADAAVLVEGNALDAGVRRFRPLIVLAESAVSPADAETRAQWEATVRATRAHRLVVKVPGWRRPLSARPWALNTLVPVDIPVFGVFAELLIVQTTFRRTRREGSTTELVLARPDAFRPQPQLEPEFEALSEQGAAGAAGGGF